MSEVGKHYGGGDEHAADPASKPARMVHQEPHGLAQAAADRLGRAATNVRGAVGGAYGKASDAYEGVASRASEVYDTASRNAVYARRRSVAEFNRGRRTVEDFVEENPIMVGVVGLAAGMLVGALLPGTRRENQVFGRYADEVRDQGMRYASGVVEQGRQLVEENLDRLQGARDRDLGDETSARG